MDIQIKIKDDVSISTSNPASIFGWDFQINSAIVLMLKNIKAANAVKIEGPTDDIEIYLNNGKVIYSQAKSVFNRDNYNSVLKNLENSLINLYHDSLHHDVEELIYITNSPNPFNNQKTVYAFSSGFNPYPYSALPQACKIKIDQILKKKKVDIDRNILSVYVLQFSQDLDNRYKVIKEHVNELINSFRIGKPDIGNIMLDIWQREFFQNASAPKPNIIIKKSEMLWPLVVILCEFNPGDEIYDSQDPAIIEEIEHNYKDIINNKTERFSFAVRVISSFDNYDTKNSNTNDRMKKFVLSHWKEYEKEFNFSSTDDKIKENVIKITLGNILNKRFKIRKIKEETGL